MKNRILFVFNAVESKEKKGIYGECASFETIKKMHAAIEEGGHDVFLINAISPEQVMAEIKSHLPIDLAFVIAEGFLGLPETLYDGSGSQKIREVIESMEIPTSHTGIEGMEFCRNKDKTYEVLKEKGILVPGHFTIDQSTPIELAFQSSGLKFPVFIKPVGGGCSVGISQNSVIHHIDDLRKQCDILFQDFGDITLIVETYLPGKEYTIGVMGYNTHTVLPIVEFPEEQIRCHEVKKNEGKTRETTAIIHSTDPIYWLLHDIAVETFLAVKASDVIRLEIRSDGQGQYYVIDVNGTPSLGYQASLFYMAETLGISYGELLNVILYFSLIRHQLLPSSQHLHFINESLSKLKAYGRFIEQAIS